jgi:hypothetical protein
MNDNPGLGHIHDRYEKLEELLVLHRTTRATLPAFFKMCFTGQCPLFDYGRGFLGVFGYVTPQENEYVVRLWFQTVDDGDYGGWSKSMSFEKAQDTLWKIADEVFTDMQALPNTEDLNKKLRPYGLYVDFE